MIDRVHVCITCYENHSSVTLSYERVYKLIARSKVVADLSIEVVSKFNVLHQNVENKP